MTNPLKKFTASPLYRNPGLLVRKAAGRLGYTSRAEFTKPPKQLKWVEQPAWGESLVSWISSTELSMAPYPWTRVFKQTFDEAFLLDRCITGPTGDYSLRGDIKLIWEFSRLQSVFLKEAQNNASVNAENIRTIHKWLGVNCRANGCNWMNAMEIAIRAVNLSAANAVSGGKIRKEIGEDDWLYWLWNHACIIESRIEAKIVSSNHYLANLLGLAVIATHLDGHRKALKWRSFAVKEFQKALLAQSYDDGGVYEASLPYHALVTEMALLLTSLPGVTLLPAFKERLEKMCVILADVMDTDGDVFRIGDDDGGRILPLDFISNQHGRSELLLTLARQLGFRPVPSSDYAVYPQSGWARFSKGPWTLAVEFGGAGFYGRGAHAHNDTLSFCLNYNGIRIFTDPGSYLYSGDPYSRNHFRSTKVHNTFGIDGDEHSPTPRDYRADLFRLPGPDVPAAITHQDNVSLSLRFALRDRKTTLSRTFTLSENELIISDTIDGSGEHSAFWHFHAAPGIVLTRDNGTVSARLDASAVVCIQPPENTDVSIEQDHVSYFYGSRQASTKLRADANVSLPASRIWKISITQQ